MSEWQVKTMHVLTKKKEKKRKLLLILYGHGDTNQTLKYINY